MSARRCQVREPDLACSEPPAYVVTFDDCDPCRKVGGFLYCQGHSACVEHAAKLRTNRYEFREAHFRGRGTVELSGDAIPCRVRNREVA